MKKLLLLITILIVPILLITGCGNKDKKVIDNSKTIELEDSGFKFKTIFKYDPSLTIDDIEYDDENKSRELSFEMTELGLDFEMYYTETGTSIFNSTKESRSNKKYYQEYKFNGYDAYCYSDYDDHLYVIISLKKDNKKDVVDELFVSIESDNVDTIVYDVFTQDTLQKFFNSIKVEEIK